MDFPTLSTTKLADWCGSITTFNGFTGTLPEQELNVVSWSGVINLVCPDTPAMIADKKQGQYFVPCKLKDAHLVGNTLEAAKNSGQPTTGKMRSKSHVTTARILVVDVDGLCETNFDAGINTMKQDGITFLAYTTYSYGREDKPGVRARLVIPLDHEIDIEEYRLAWHGADQKYWGGKAGQADASGANLYQQQGTWACDPSRAELAKKWQHNDGVISADALISIGKAARPQPTSAATKSSVCTSEHSHHKKDPDRDYPASDANKVADKCRQIGLFRDNKGAEQSEPLWFDCLGVVGFCSDGEEHAQEWSSGHRDYDPDATLKKLAYRLHTPPTTCAQLRNNNPGGCEGCTQVCRSPITLGWQDAFTAIKSTGSDGVMAVDSLLPASAPTMPVSDDEAIARLASMSPLDYERARAEQAKRMGCRPAVLDSLVKQARKEEPSPTLPFSEVEPYPEQIDPAKLLDEVADVIHRFIVMDNEQADATVLWVAFTWFIDVAAVAPLAIINAPEKACGKSQLLDLIGRMSARPLPAANSTAAGLFRAVELWSPTVLIDEADTFIRDNDELKGLINAGHTRANAFVLRVVGDNHEPKMFKVWGAKALAGITLEKHLPDATLSRAIVINLRRKLPHESVARLRHADAEMFEVIASKLARFALDYSQQVRQARPPLPDTLSDRAQDNWEPLLAIAQCAGPAWVQLATSAALKLSGAGEASVSTGNELLADIQHVFESKSDFKISTADLIQALVEDDEKPWATYNRGKPLSPRQLAKQLSAYGIKSKTVRLGYANTPKGFDKAQFEDAFARYLTLSESPEQQRNILPGSMNSKGGGVSDEAQQIRNVSDVTQRASEHPESAPHVPKPPLRSTESIRNAGSHAHAGEWRCGR